MMVKVLVTLSIFMGMSLALDMGVCFCFSAPIFFLGGSSCSHVIMY